jgi:hypothetical protein
MSDNRIKHDGVGDPSRDDVAKKPYETPAIVSEEVFETLALSCTKHTGKLCSHGVSKS